MSYSYKVLQRGFIGGALRDPGNPRHDPYVTEDKLDPQPSWLELIKKPAKKRAPVKKMEKAAATQAVDNPPAPGQFQGKVATDQVKFED